MSTITLPKDVLNAISEKGGRFIACASAGLKPDGIGLSDINTDEVTLEIGDSKYSIEQVNGFELVEQDGNKVLQDANKQPVPAPAAASTEIKGGASVYCEKCARKTRSRRHKRAGRRLRKSSKKV